MSTRTRQEGASILNRILALILLPVIVVIFIFIAIVVAVLIVVGGILDVLQFVFFGSTGAIRWVGRRVSDVGDFVQGIAR